MPEDKRNSRLNAGIFADVPVITELLLPDALQSFRDFMHWEDTRNG